MNSKLSPKFVFLATVTLLLISGVKAQDPIFSQFYANPLYVNPAFAGTKKCTRLHLNYRNQPFPVFGTYSTYSFSADNYWQTLNGGIGFNLVHDSQGGLVDQSQAGLFYAWHGQLSRYWNISLGIQGSYLNHSINQANLIFPDQFNVSQNTAVSGESIESPLNSHNIDFSTGILVYSDRLYIGFAAHHLNQPTLMNFDDQKLPAKYTLMAGYDLTSQHNRTAHQTPVKWSTNIIMQSQSGFLRINYGIYSQLDQLIAGVWFRHSVKHPNSLIFMVGLKQVNYTVAYSYDYSLSGFSWVFGGAHEISVLLNFNCPEPNMKYRILNCPAF